MIAFKFKSPVNSYCYTTKVRVQKTISGPGNDSTSKAFWGLNLLLENKKIHYSNHSNIFYVTVHHFSYNFKSAKNK